MFGIKVIDAPAINGIGPSASFGQFPRQSRRGRWEKAFGQGHPGRTASQGRSQAPAIRSSSDCERAQWQASDEQEDARHEDERGVAGNLFRQRRERANVQQHAGSDCDKGGTDQAGDRFRGVIYAPLRMAPSDL